MKVWLTLCNKDVMISSAEWELAETSEPTDETALDKALRAMAAGEITSIEIEREEE